MRTQTNKYHWARLRKFAFDVFVRAGAPERAAGIVADSLIQADLRGVDSHGVVRLAIYMKRVEKKLLNPSADVEIISENDAITLIDGHNNFGAVVGSKALRIALQKSEDCGVTAVGVRGSNHFGIGAYYALQAIKQDKILLVLSNASQTMPPTGGIRPFIGTNPLTVGVPSGVEMPFLLDMATSVVARGKIIVAAEKKENIPDGWAIDKGGMPTTDPEKALLGSVLPLGGAKGYGISMFIDILSGVLTGAGFGKYINNMYENWNDPQNVGHMFIAVDIDHFIPLSVFKNRMDTYIREIKSEPTAPGFKEILIPGELEYRRTIERKQSGIELPSSVAEALLEIGSKYSVDIREALL